METLRGAGKLSRPLLERTTWEPDTIVRHLVARAIVAWETGALAIWNLFNDQITQEEKKRDPNHVLTATISTSVIDAYKFNSYWKLVRTTA
jgi:hypothetical protein